MRPKALDNMCMGRQTSLKCPHQQIQCSIRLRKKDSVKITHSGTWKLRKRKSSDKFAYLWIGKIYLLLFVTTKEKGCESFAKLWHPSHKNVSMLLQEDEVHYLLCFTLEKLALANLLLLGLFCVHKTKVLIYFTIRNSFIYTIYFTTYSTALCFSL